MKMYFSELMRTTSHKTNKVTYWIKKCNTFSRITYEEYSLRFARADGVTCLYSKSDKNFTRQFLTVSYEVNK